MTMSRNDRLFSSLFPSDYPRIVLDVFSLLAGFLEMNTVNLEAAKEEPGSLIAAHQL